MLTWPPLGHPREQERLLLLHAYCILDTPREDSFDQIAQLAAAITHAPIALVSFVDRHRQWNKALCGLDTLELPRSQSFCARAVLHHAGLGDGPVGPFVIEDASADPRFAESPLCTGPARVRCYAGQPLSAPDSEGSGLAVGMLCVMDRVPRQFDPRELEMLRLLAGQALFLLENRRTIAQLGDQVAKTRVKAGDLEERERRALEERFRILFEHSSDAHLIFDEAGIVDCNHAAVAMLHCQDKRQVLSLHPAQISPEFQPDGRPSLEKCIEMDALARQNGQHRFDWVHRRLDGRDFPVEVTLTPVTLSGKPALLTVWHDLTERKRAEDELRRAKEAAEAATRAKAEFLATMSHELRTPLNGVLGMTTLLLNSSPSGQQRAYAQTIKSSGEALLALINDILEVSQLDAGPIKLVRGAFSPRALISEVAAAVAEGARQKGLDLAIRVQPGVPEQLSGDLGRIRQILFNLAGNAVKFTSRGQVLLSAGTESEGPGRVRLLLGVRDTGIGIPAEAQGRLFQAFSQLDSSMTRSYGGTGLGLAICWRLSQAMGGTIQVKSEVGHGSEFTFHVSLQVVQDATAKAERAPEMPALRSGERAWELQPLQKSYRVLVVDDNGVNGLVVGAMLERLNCQATIVENSAAALTELAKEAYDVVLMDCQMPEMDGFELTRRIRQGPGKNQRTGIVALTANAMPGDRERCLDAGMDDYLPKPVDIVDLRRALLVWGPRS